MPYKTYTETQNETYKIHPDINITLIHHMLPHVKQLQKHSLIFLKQSVHANVYLNGLNAFYK